MAYALSKNKNIASTSQSEEQSQNKKGQQMYENESSQQQERLKDVEDTFEVVMRLQQ